MTVAMNDLSAIRPATREFLAADHQNFIDGKWCPAVSGKTLEVLDPATGEAVSRVPDSDAADVNAAVAAARRAFERRVSLPGYSMSLPVTAIQPGQPSPAIRVSTSSPLLAQQRLAA
jgi:hypothetical protein